MSWTGSLDTAPADSVPVDTPGWADEEEPNPLLVRALQDAHNGMSQGYELLPLFFSTQVWVETEPAEQGQVAVRSVYAQGLSWLPVYTSLPRLAQFAQMTGRGEVTITYGQLPGREVVRDLLPHLPSHTGIVLDPGSEHVFALPPADAEEVPAT